MIDTINLLMPQNFTSFKTVAILNEFHYRLEQCCDIHIVLNNIVEPESARNQV